MPSPITTTVSPSVGCARRTPCSAIAPSVTVDAGADVEPLRDADGEVDRHVDQLGVVRDPGAGAGDAVADAEPVHLARRRATTTPAAE